MLQHLGITQHWWESFFQYFRNLFTATSISLGFDFSLVCLFTATSRTTSFKSLRLCKLVHFMLRCISSWVSIEYRTPWSQQCNACFNQLRSLVFVMNLRCCSRIALGFVNRPFSRGFDTYSSVSSTFTLKVDHCNINFVYCGYVIAVSLLISYFYLNVRPPLCKLFTCICLFL